MNEKTVSRALLGLIIALLLALSTVLTANAQSLVEPQEIEQTSTCPTTLKITASLGGCDNVFVGWTYTGSSPVIRQTLVYGDGFSPALSLSANSYSRTGVGPCYHTAVTITQTYANGQTCMASYHDNHNRCDGCGGVAARVSVVLSANYRSQVSRGSIGSIFPDEGATFTNRQEFTTSFNLPTTLGGLTVEINGAPCSLFAVSPGQINFLLPDWLPDGPTEVPITVMAALGNTPKFSGRAQVNPQAPGIFTRNSTGEGRASSLWLIFYPGGGFNYFTELPALNGSEQVYFILYGTGINSTQAELRLTNGRTFPSFHVANSIFAGVKQLTFRIPNNDLWRAETGAFVRVFTPAGYYDSQGFTVK